MTWAAHHQGFTLSGNHVYHPRWFGLPSRAFQVCKLAHMMDLNILSCATQLADLR